MKGLHKGFDISNILFICLFLFFCNSDCQGMPRIAETSTANETFGICDNSFFQTPSINLYITSQPEFICLIQEKNRNTNLKCGNNPDEMCIGVYYLTDYKIPLFSGLHIYGDVPIMEDLPNRAAIEKQAKMINRDSGDSTPWQTRALNRDGEDRQCDINAKSWQISGTGITRGHVMPASLGKLINLDTAVASFSMFNVAPQFEEQNNNIMEQKEKVVLQIARNCKSNIKIIKSHKQEKTQWKSSDFLFDKARVHTDFYFVSGTLPTDIDSSDHPYPLWIDRSDEGLYHKIGSFINRPGSNVPSVFWTAVCCLYSFNDIGYLPLTFGYYIVNRKSGIEKHTASLDDLKDWLGRESKQYNYRTIQVDNFFGVNSPCEKTLTYQQVAELLHRYTGDNEDVKKNLQVKQLMLSFPRAFEQSSFPKKLPNWKWGV